MEINDLGDRRASRPTYLTAGNIRVGKWGVEENFITLCFLVRGGAGCKDGGHI